MTLDDKWFGSAHQTTYMAGDIYPSNFSFRHPQFNHDLYTLWGRNEFIQLLIDWMPFEAFRRWVQHIEDEGPISGFKFKKPYIFKGYSAEDQNTKKPVEMTGFEEYCQWKKIQEKFILGVSFSRLYPDGALIVMLDEEKTYPKFNDEGQTIINWPANPNPQGYDSFKVFQPVSVGLGTGFKPFHSDENGEVDIWEVVLQTKNMKKGKTFHIEADRCIHLKWISKNNEANGSSRCQGIARVAQLENNIFEKLTKRAHDIAGGILKVLGVASEAEATKILNDMGDDLTSVDVVMLQAGRDMNYETPDLKAAGEFASIFEMFSRKLCRHMRVSQLILDGEHTGAGLGGNNDVEMLNSYSEIYQIQEHYRTDLERVFYKLGKSNTSFIYNEILPEDMAVDEGETETQDGEESNGEENKKEKQSDASD